MMSTRRASEVAATAMELFQVLGQQPTQSFAILFDENSEEVTRALLEHTLHWAMQAKPWHGQSRLAEAVR